MTKLPSEAFGSPDSPVSPTVVFIGDFNVGKSALVNSLLRRETLLCGREETRGLPTFLARSDRREAEYVAYHSGDGTLTPKSHEEFLNIHHERGNEAGYSALGAGLPVTPFSNLVFIDTAGMSSDILDSTDVTHLADDDNLLVVVVADIDYWAAKHTLDMIAAHRENYGHSLLVVANKADRLNYDEIRRISERAQKRMEAYGISPAPAFFALSARLEAARAQGDNEYRQRTKESVRECCAGGFDAFRVALYEFEAVQNAQNPAPPFEDIFSTPLSSSFIENQDARRAVLSAGGAAQ
jgi:GTP-binding protein EngB required for normal cell division